MNDLSLRCAKRLAMVSAAALLATSAGAGSAPATSAPLTNGDSGTTVPVRVGQVLTVVLSGAAGTGYDWRLVGGGGVAEVGPSRLTKSGSPAGFVGGPVTRTFQLRVQRGGEQAVTFVQERPWMRGKEKVEVATFILDGR